MDATEHGSYFRSIAILALFECFLTCDNLKLHALQFVYIRTITLDSTQQHSIGHLT